TGPDMLARGEVDACLLVGSSGVRRFEPAARAGLAGIPTVVLDGPDTEAQIAGTVQITTATPGVDVGGTGSRLDAGAIPLRAGLPPPGGPSPPGGPRTPPPSWGRSAGG